MQNDRKKTVEEQKNLFRNTEEEKKKRKQEPVPFNKSCFSRDNSRGELYNL